MFTSSSSFFLSASHILLLSCPPVSPGESTALQHDCRSQQNEILFSACFLFVHCPVAMVTSSLPRFAYRPYTRHSAGARVRATFQCVSPLASLAVSLPHHSSVSFCSPPIYFHLFCLCPSVDYVWEGTSYIKRPIRIQSGFSMVSFRREFSL